MPAKPKDVTILSDQLVTQRLNRRAGWYVEKYHPSAQGLTAFLQRYAQKNLNNNPSINIKTAIDGLVNNFKENGLINDDKLSRAYYDQYSHLGYSHHKIVQKLRAKGFTPPAESKHSPETEWDNAQYFADKRRIWHLPQEKFMRRLAAAGFSFEIARQLWQKRGDNGGDTNE